MTITWLGSLYLLLPLAASISFLLAWAGRSGQAVLLSLSLLMTTLSVHTMKLMFRRPRPAIVPESLLVPMPSDWSFPSAHTAQSTAFFLALSLIAIRILPPFWASIFSLFSLMIIVIIGYSRIYLQVHYLSDVLAGIVLAALIVSAMQVVIPLLPWVQGK